LYLKLDEQLILC